MFDQINLENAAYGGLIAIISGIAGFVINNWLKVRAAIHVERKENNEQAISLYRELIEGLRKEMDKLKTDSCAMEDEYIKAREEIAQIREENRHLKG